MSDAVAYEKAQEFFCAFSLIRIWTEDLIESKKTKVHDFLLYILTDIAEIEKVTLDSMVKVTELRIKEAVMWIFYAIGSSFFAGITAILAKCGIQKTDSDVATAIRTVVVQIFSWLMVLITGAGSGIGKIGTRTMVFLVLSGLSTGASWLCYFHALQKGDINKVVPVDKSSTILTIILALISRKETQLKQEKEKHGSWLIYAVLSAVFASLTSILGKIGIQDIDSNLGTAIRTTVVLIMAWLMVFITGKQRQIRKTEKKELAFIILSGFATGASWLCYYHALQQGPASVVVAVDKLSILVTIAFSWAVFHEKLTKKAALGVMCMTVGTLLLAVM